MAKRKSINKRLSRYSKLSTGSAILDPDTVNLGYEETYWWGNLEDNSIARSSRRSGISNQTSCCLNDSSHLETSNGKEKWWEPLKEYDESGALMIPTSNAKKAEKVNDPEPSISESDDELQVRKKKRTLLGYGRRNRDTASLNVSSNTEDPISKPAITNQRETAVASKNSKIQSSRNRQDSTDEPSISESDEQFKIKRKKRTLRGVSRKSRENAFLKVLTNTRESTSVSLPTNRREVSTASKLSNIQPNENQQESTDESTAHIFKPKPKIFRKRIASNTDVFDDESKELAHTPSKRKSPRVSSIAATENLAKNKYGKRTSIISQALISQTNLSLENVGDYLQLDIPKAQSTVLEDSESSIHNTLKEADKDESETQILKSRPIFLKRDRKKVSHNSFEDILMDETIEDKSKSKKLINTSGNLRERVSREESQVGDQTKTSMSSRRNTSLDKTRHSARAETDKSPSTEKHDTSLGRLTRSTKKSNTLVEQRDVPDDVSDASPDRSNRSEFKSRYLKNANKSSNRATMSKSFDKGDGNPTEQSQKKAQLDDAANTSRGSRNNVSMDQSKDDIPSKTEKLASIAKTGTSIKQADKSIGRSSNMVEKTHDSYMFDSSSSSSGIWNPKSKLSQSVGKNEERNMSKSLNMDVSSKKEPNRNKSQINITANTSQISRKSVNRNKSKGDAPSKIDKSPSKEKNDVSPSRITRSIRKSNTLGKENDDSAKVSDSSFTDSEIFNPKYRLSQNADKNAEQRKSTPLNNVVLGNKGEHNHDESQVNHTTTRSEILRRSVSQNKSRFGTQSEIVKSPSIEKTGATPRRRTRSIRKSNTLVEENDDSTDESESSSDANEIFNPTPRVSHNMGKNAEQRRSASSNNVELSKKEERNLNNSQFSNATTRSEISRRTVSQNKSRVSTQSELVKSPSIEKTGATPRRRTRSIRKSNTLVEENDDSTDESESSSDANEIFNPTPRVSHNMGKNAEQRRSASSNNVELSKKEERNLNNSQFSNATTRSEISRRTVSQNKSRVGTQSEIVKSPSIEKTGATPRRRTRSIRKSNTLVEENDASTDVSESSSDDSEIFNPTPRVSHNIGKNAKQRRSATLNNVELGNKEERNLNNSQFSNATTRSEISRRTVSQNKSRVGTQSEIVKSPSIEKTGATPRRRTRSIRKSNTLVEENDDSTDVSESSSDDSEIFNPTPRVSQNIGKNAKQRRSATLNNVDRGNKEEHDRDKSKNDDTANASGISRNSLSENRSSNDTQSKIVKSPLIENNAVTPTRRTRSMRKSNNLVDENDVSTNVSDSTSGKFSISGSKFSNLKNVSDNSRRKVSTKSLGKAPVSVIEEESNVSKLDDAASTIILFGHNVSSLEKSPSLEKSDVTQKRKTGSIRKSNNLVDGNNVSTNVLDSIHLKNATNNSRRKITSKFFSTALENMNEEDHDESESEDLASTTIISEHNVIRNEATEGKSASMDENDISPRTATKSIRGRKILAKENDVPDDLSNSHYNKTDASNPKARFSKNQRIAAEQNISQNASKRSKISGSRSSKIDRDRSKQNTPSSENNEASVEATIANRKVTVESEVDSDAILLRFSPLPDETDQDEINTNLKTNVNTLKKRVDDNIGSVTMESGNSRVRSNRSPPKDRAKSTGRIGEVANDSRNTSNTKSADDRQKHRRKTPNRKTTENIVSNADAEDETQDYEVRPARSNERASRSKDKNAERSNRSYSDRNDDEIISSHPSQLSIERSPNDFVNGIENISRNRSQDSNSPSRRTSSSIGVSSISFITSAKGDTSKNLVDNVTKLHILNTPSLPVEERENVGNSSKQVLTQQKIDKFFQMYKPTPNSQAFVGNSAIENVKKQLEEVKKKEMLAMKLNAEARERSLQLQRKNMMTKFGGFTKKKKQPAKQVDKAFLVNGAVYKVPRLPRPQSWVTDRLYRFLWKHMKVKYEMEKRVRSEKFVKQLSDVLSFILKQKKYAHYEMELNVLMLEMARLHIIRTRNDFYNFCRDFLPYEIREKIIPTMLPGNRLTIPHDTSTLNKPLLDSS